MPLTGKYGARHPLSVAEWSFVCETAGLMNLKTPEIMTKYIFLLLMLPVLTCAQTLYVPNATNGIGSSLNGNVGIGTNVPASILDVNGRALFRRQGSANAGFLIGGDALTLQGWDTHTPYIEWLTSGGIRQGYMGWNTDRLSLGLENGYNFTIENGNVGIGINSPDSKLTVNGSLRVIDPALTSWKLGFGANGDPIRHLSVDVVNSALDTDPLELVYNRGTGVSIGTLGAADKFLKVYGTAYAKEINVTLSIPGPDYVFEKDYNLLPLAELEAYINQNKHLPEVPSAKRDGSEWA
jgi:hypothetical protein